MRPIIFRGLTDAEFGSPLSTDGFADPSMTKQAQDPAAPRATGAGETGLDRAAVIVAPVLALIALAALFLLLAWRYSATRTDLLIASSATAAAAGLFAAVHLYRATRRHLAADRGLRGAEARVRSVVDAAMDPIVTIDEAQRILSFNAAAEQAFRCPRRAVIGQPLEMLIPERFRDAHHGHVDRFGRTGVMSRRMGAQAVLRALRANGEEFPIEASIAQHTDSGMRFYTVILRDISERLRIESLLARSEARLRGILDSAMVAIITVDERQCVVLFNNAAESMFGWSRDEVLGKPLEFLMPERFRAAHAGQVKVFGATAMAERRMGNSLRIVTGLRRSGEEFPIDASISWIDDSGSKFFTVIMRDMKTRFRDIEALKRSKEELQELGAAASMTREQEKSRIARELHDELGQLLTMLQMDVAWCSEKLPPGDDTFAAKLERMAALLKSTIVATRRIAADLRPLMLDDLGLVPSIEWLVENFSQRTGIVCALTVGDADLHIPASHASAVFRIVQESLTNITKHAQASHTDIVIEHDDGRLVVRIEDDGVGFSPLAPRNPGSLGLFGLRERAVQLGGEATITSTPGRGTIVEARLPMSTAVAAP